MPWSSRALLGILLALQLPVVMAQQGTVSGGKVAGLAMRDGSTIFHGIAYAAARHPAIGGARRAASGVAQRRHGK